MTGPDSAWTPTSRASVSSPELPVREAADHPDIVAARPGIAGLVAALRTTEPVLVLHANPGNGCITRVPVTIR